jgi:hypothetical protein
MPTEPTRSKGLRKYIPQPDRFAERYGRFTLTARDLSILDLVYRYRFVEARHVRALIGGSGQQVTRRLQGLFHNGFLGRYARRERMRLELDPGAPLIAYGLETKGARALERFFATDTEATPVQWKKEYSRRTEWFLEHQLMISNFRCVLELALRATPDAELVTWCQGKRTWLRVSIPESRRRFVRLAPDAYFVLRRDNEVRHFFLEADRSTEEHRRIVDKFVGYWRHLDASSTEQGQARRRTNVLMLMTDERRMMNVIDTLRAIPKPKGTNHAGKGTFWFATDRVAAIDTPASILDLVWQSAATIGGGLSICP